MCNAVFMNISSARVKAIVGRTRHLSIVANAYFAMCWLLWLQSIFL